ncbi:IS3 family transposase [Mammaliicoccus sciuri]|uniref:IS3 family transposase n=1 Tax=Mammaliicoccus sciuri TaxID=1296 RepID=UPI0034DD863C
MRRQYFYENYFGILKQEMYHGKELFNYESLKLRIENYIYLYNNERLKLKLARLSPVHYQTKSSQLLS